MIPLPPSGERLVADSDSSPRVGVGQFFQLSHSQFQRIRPVVMLGVWKVAALINQNPHPMRLAKVDAAPGEVVAKAADSHLLVDRLHFPLGLNTLLGRCQDEILADLLGELLRLFDLSLQLLWRKSLR